jgi:hypothetical protein
MTLPPVTGWEPWGPPLDPPTSGGLSAALAQGIADATLWPASPHLTAALQWEAYATTLQPTSPVSSVSTGAQSVSYEPAMMPGAYGDALRQAEWHRSFLGDTYSVPLSSPSESVEYSSGDDLAPIIGSRQAIVWGPNDFTAAED